MSKAGSEKAGGDQGLGEIAPAMLETVPYVGRLVGTMARMALEESEQAQIERCLIEALRIDDFVHKRRIRNYLPSIGKRRAARAAQRQATLDLAADVDLMAFALPSPERSPEQSDDGARPPRQVPKSTRELARFVYETARTELDDALNEETFVPWTQRLAGSFTLIATQHWDGLEKGGGDERSRWARLVMNDRHADPGDVNPFALQTFGQRVGLRFEIALVRNPTLAPIVGRLDLCDRQRAETSLLAATQGIRRALLLLLLMAAVLFVALMGEAGAGHLAVDLFEGL